MLKVIKAFILPLAFMSTIGIQNADAACTRWLNPVTCDSNTTYTVYGSAAGAINPTEECYAYTVTSTGNVTGYLKFINFNSCNTSKGFNATPITQTSSFSYCVGSPNNPATYPDYNSCEISSSLLCSVAHTRPTLGLTDVGNVIKQKVSNKFLLASGCQETETVYLLNGGYFAEIQVCTKCYPSSTLVPSLSYDMQIPEMADLLGCTGFMYEYGCRYCGNACSSGTWADVSGHTGYQWRTAGDHPIDSCDCGNEYRCAANYYGTPSVSGTTYSGCTACGTIFGVQSTSSAGSTSCASCCIPANSTGSDNTGSIVVESECCQC